MRQSTIKILCAAALAAGMAVSCSKVLDEKPRATLTPEFFKSEQGIKGGLTSLYAHLRYIYGQAYYYNICETGTDEATWAHDADNNFKDADLSGVGNLTSTSSRSDVLWGTAFANINTCSGIIENAAAVGINEALISEARFFRAFDYFQLVQTFGGVPLDLGAGELMFNTTPSRTSVRNTVPEVYTRAIFPDLKTAIENLPDAGRVTGGATKTLARLFLAKAYLTYAWWLENPKGIATYPECGRTDPDGHDAKWYFQAAYDTALGAIKSPAGFGLMDNYYDVNNALFDRNKEILLYADHTEKDEFYNGGSLYYGSGGAPDNFAGWMMNWNYPNLRLLDASGNQVESTPRTAEQPYGRPWTRMCPTVEVIRDIFSDKEHDSRFDGTFTSVYRGNWDKTGKTFTELFGANGMSVKLGEPVLTFLGEEPETAIVYPQQGSKDNIGVGTLPGRADYVVSPEGINRQCFPGLWKLGPYRTDNNGSVGQPNAGSTRPFNIAKFSELYLVAAEAAVKGATGSMSARELVNVLRERAGRWNKGSDDANIRDKKADYSKEMADVTPAQIDVNYILDERMREFYGEGYRWQDLVRTQMWKERASSYSIAGYNFYDKRELKTYTRTIEDFHYLRPIPQGQLDGMEMTSEEKEAYQNPGYRNK